MHSGGPSKCASLSIFGHIVASSVEHDFLRLGSKGEDGVDDVITTLNRFPGLGNEINKFYARFVLG
jgi:hypothetical protein